jgi:hypothetical protein
MSDFDPDDDEEAVALAVAAYRLRCIPSTVRAPSGSFNYAVSLDGLPLSLWRSREEPVP